MDFLRIFQHLLPDGRAWRTTINKRLRQFFQGLTVLIEDVKAAADQNFEDVFPQTTSELDTWESQFGLPPLTGEQARRDRLAATWRELFGGQDPRYIQDTLRAAGFDVYIHQWWEPVPGRPNGGSVDGNATPVARNPLLYLDDGAFGTPFTMFDGGVEAQDGDAAAQDGGTATPVGYPLVNKVLESSTGLIGDGSASVQDGGVLAQDGGTVVSYGDKQYIIPKGDPDVYPYFLYIGGETFPETAQVPESRRNEFESLCLKICPTQQWLGILVTYN